MFTICYILTDVCHMLYSYRCLQYFILLQMFTICYTLTDVYHILYTFTDGAEDVDPYDLLEPVDVIAALPKDYFDKIVCTTHKCYISN